MAAGKYSFIIEQGTTFTRTFNYKDANGEPISLDNHTIRMQIRSSYDSLGVIDDLTEAGGNFTVTTPVGTDVSSSINLTISATDTANYNFDQALYDLEIQEDTTGVVTRLLQGKVKLSREVTK